MSLKLTKNCSEISKCLKSAGEKSIVSQKFQQFFEKNSNYLPEKLAKIPQKKKKKNLSAWKV